MDFVDFFRVIFFMAVGDSEAVLLKKLNIAKQLRFSDI